MNKDNISHVAIKLMIYKFMNESVGNPDSNRANELDASQDYKIVKQ